MIDWQQIWQNNSIKEEYVNDIPNLANSYPYFSAAQIALAANNMQLNPQEKKIILNNALSYIGNPYLFFKNINQFKIIKAQQNSDDIITPPFAENYFAFQKIEAKPEEVETFVQNQKTQKEKTANENIDINPMITMSFSEWLAYFKQKKEKEKKELESKEALRAMWQKEKLTAAIEEENDIVPENVFKMAIDSLSLSENTASESLAEIMLNQGKIDKALEMYRKLSLLNPEKSSYFASKINKITKNSN